MSQPLRLVFMGTPDFALSSLRTVLAGGFKVAAVATQPDRPRGRGQRVTSSPVKIEAASQGIPVWQPRQRGQADIIPDMQRLQPDLILVAAFGQMLSAEILAIPSLGVLNVHPSLLPLYRGAAPINWAIIRGDTLTGVSIMWMTQEMDAGDIFLQETEPIHEDDTAGTLGSRLADRGGRLLVKALHAVERGEIIKIPQRSEGVVYAPALTKEMQLLNFGRPALELQRLIRGLDPKPGALTYLHHKVLKVFRPALAAPRPHLPLPGTVIQVSAAGAEVACGDGSLWLQELQPAGGRRLSALEFSRGRRLINERLG
ncbi:MAG TPA: methionyl-tRNA formyltransferase [Desulfobacterales bacterium]|nr:methionyl-tRNA formyltransferase [Desulfobacterales bacterium]